MLSVNGLYIRFIVKVKQIVIISVSGLYQLGFNYRREREKDRAHVHREFAPVMVTEKCEDRRVLPQEG